MLFGLPALNYFVAAIYTAAVVLALRSAAATRAPAAAPATA
jgi:hypothetical protein